jgi:TolB protein
MRMSARLLVATCSLFAAAAVAQPVAEPTTAIGPIVGDVEGGTFRPFPMAVPAVRASAALSAQAEVVSKIVRDDLRMSGAFQILDPKSFIDSDGIRANEVRFADWQTVGAQGLAKAELRTDGTGIAVELHGYEVSTQKEAVSKVLAGQGDLRALGHAVADELYRAFTGEPGVFRTKIVLVKKVQGEKHLFVTDVDGENSRQLTKSGGLNLLPSFSPDGRSVLFTSYRNDNPDLFEINLGDGAVKPISQRPGLNTGGRYSPDGKAIAVTLSQDGNSEVYLLDRAGAITKRLTDSWGIDTSPAWMPDGTGIAFVSSRGKNPQIYLAGRDGSNVRQLTFKGNYNQTPAVSPRGTHLAFTARDEHSKFDIFVLNLKTNEVVRVTQDTGNNEEPSFSPNGRLLVFTTTRNGPRQMVVSTLDGQQQTVLPSTSEHSSPCWGPFLK